MFQNYLAAAWRNLLRNKLYATINITGLAIGLCAALIVGLFLRNELSFEQGIPEYQRIYTIAALFAPRSGAPIAIDVAPSDVAPWLATKIPELRPIVRLTPAESHGIRVHGVDLLTDVSWADPDFFSVLRLPAIAGNPALALQTPDGVVLTRTEARRLFGRDDPIGQMLEVDGQYSLRVTAVLADLPPNTHLQFALVASARSAHSPLADNASRQSDVPASVMAYAYFKLPARIGLQRVREALVEIAAHETRVASQGSGALAPSMFLPVSPIAAIHFLPEGAGSMKPRGSVAALYSIAAIGLLILLIAVINFVNLSTARAARRSADVGVRKAVGATRGDLIVQFVGEAFFYAALSALCAAAFTELALPGFNSLVGTELTLRYWHDPQAMGLLLGLTLIVGALAGSYPAFVLSSFRPVVALRARGVVAGGAAVRYALVMAQFAVLIVMLVAVIVIFQQTDYAKKMVGRLHTAQIIAIPDACKGSAEDAYRALPGVIAVACTESLPLNVVQRLKYSRVRGQTQTVFRVDVIGFDFFQLYGLQPVAGRLFGREHPNDAASGSADQATMGPVVINETAVHRFGFASAQAAIGELVTVLGDRPSQVIGVVPDFPVSSVRNAVEATVFHIDPQASKTLDVKVDSVHQAQALAAVDALWERLNPSRPTGRLWVEEALRDLYADIVRDGLVFCACSAIALMLACLGLFGLSSFTAERRTKEVGIRKALGATQGDILRLLIWQLTTPVLWANVLGLPIAYFLMQRWLNGFAYHMQLSILTLLAAGGIALGIAWLTVLGHALRVAREKPVLALRYE